MATPENTLITRAEVTSITNATTGRKAFTLDGTTIELGDTGLRDLSGKYTAGRVASGRVLVQRVGKVVTWHLVSLNLAAGATTIWSVIAGTSTVPELNGFRPKYTAASALMQSETEYARLVIGQGGSVDIHYGIAGVNYIGSFSYITDDAWPATALPGVADGQPVGV